MRLAAPLSTKSWHEATEFATNQRYDFHRILWLKEGKGTISVDFRPFDLLANQLYFFSPRQMVSLEKSDIVWANALFFSDDFLYSHTNDEDFLVRCNLLDNPETPFVLVPENHPALADVLSLIQAELQQPTNLHRTRILRNYLKAFLLHAERLKDHPDASPTLTNDCMVFLSFKKNVARQINIHRSVTEYAYDLNVTPKQLNRVVKKLVGTTPHQYINQRLLLEAKRRLCFDHQSIQEIAYALGFSDASNFSRTFKQLEGLSPETFRHHLYRN